MTHKLAEFWDKILSYSIKHKYEIEYILSFYSQFQDLYRPDHIDEYYYVARILHILPMYDNKSIRQVLIRDETYANITKTLATLEKDCIGIRQIPFTLDNATVYGLYIYILIYVNALYVELNHMGSFNLESLVSQKAFLDEFERLSNAVLTPDEYIQFEMYVTKWCEIWISGDHSNVPTMNYDFGRFVFTGL